MTCVITDRQDKIQPYLALGITYNYGPIWDMKWCPSGCWQQHIDENSVNVSQINHKILMGNKAAYIPHLLLLNLKFSYLDLDSWQ